MQRLESVEAVGPAIGPAARHAFRRQQVAEADLDGRAISVASSEQQIANLLDRLHLRTTRGETKWQRSPEPDRYQTRVGDFLINIGPSGSTLNRLNNSIALTVTRME